MGFIPTTKVGWLDGWMVGWLDGWMLMVNLAYYLNIGHWNIFESLVEPFHLVPISFECVFCWKIFCQVVRSILPSFDLWRRPMKGWNDADWLSHPTKENHLQDANDSTQLKLLLSCNLGLRFQIWLDTMATTWPWWMLQFPWCFVNLPQVNRVHVCGWVTPYWPVT